jgi:hypothetical protein
MALVLRFGVLSVGPWHDPGRALEPDSFRYLRLADNLERYSTFGKESEDGLVHVLVQRLRTANATLPPADANGLRPESFRLPAYPVFIAATERVQGDVRLTLVAQCVIGALSAAMAVHIAIALGLSIGAAWIVGLLWAVHPALILHDNLILTESLFNALTIGSLFLLARGGPVAAALGGAGLGMAGLVRPLAVLYLPLAFAVAWPRLRTRRVAAVVTVLALLPSTVWAWRNWAVGEGLRVSTVADLNLLFYSAAYSISESRHEDWHATWPRRVGELGGRLARRLSPGEDVISAGRRLATEELMARPQATARVYMLSMSKLALDHSMPGAARIFGTTYVPSGLVSSLLSGTFRTRSGGAMVAAAAAWTLFNAALLLAAAIGCVVAARRRAWRVLTSCAVTIALFAAATGSVGLERFRLPLILPLLVLGAYGCAAMGKRHDRT